MGTYHTFFVAGDDDLDRLFPGWKRPEEKPTPLARPSLYDDVWGAAVPPIVEVMNDYMQIIEEAGPPGLRTLPHFRAKNCDAFVLFDPLVAALVADHVPSPPIRVGCDADDDIPSVWALPAVAAKALANMKDSDLMPIMEKVLAADIMGTGEVVDYKAKAFMVDNVLWPLKTLAQEASRRGGHVCHYYALHH
jgi:hypothetical protein